MADSIEMLLDEGTRGGWDDRRSHDDLLASIDALVAESDPVLRAGIDALMSHSASPADSMLDACAIPCAAPEHDDLVDDASSPPPTAASDPVSDASDFSSDPASDPVSDASDFSSDPASDPVSDASDLSSDPVSDASDLSSDAASDASDAGSDSAPSAPPTPPTPAPRLLNRKRRHAADDAPAAAARALFVADVVAPTFFAFQFGPQTGIFDSAAPPTDFFRGSRAETRTPLEHLLLSRLLFYTAARDSPAWSPFNADASVYADADLMSWFLAPSYPLLLLCAVHAAFRGSVAADSPLENSARGALLRALLARLVLLRELRDMYRAQFAALQSPAVRAHVLGQPCRFAAAARIPDGYARLTCTAEDCVIAHYRYRFVERFPSGLLPNAAELCARKKSAEAFPAVGNLPFCRDDLERHWCRDLPPLDCDLFRDTLAPGPSGGPRYPAGPRIFFSPSHGAFFATLPPSQAAHGSELVGAIRLPFALGGRTGARCGRLCPDAQAALDHLCEAERVSGAVALRASATRHACREAGITSPLLPPRQRARWLFATRRVFDDRDDLVRDVYPLSQATFDVLIATTTARPPAAKRRRASPPLPPAH